MADARVRAAPARLLTAGSGRVRLVDDETGDPFRMTELATHLDQPGYLDDARQWWRRSAEAGAVSAMLHLANDLEHDGELGEAEMWLRRATEAGVHDGLAVLARLPATK